MLLKRLLQRVSEEDLQSVMDNIVEMAKAGSLEHQKLLLYYTFGKPVQMLNQEHSVSPPTQMRVIIIDRPVPLECGSLNEGFQE